MGTKLGSLSGVGDKKMLFGYEIRIIIWVGDKIMLFGYEIRIIIWGRR